MATTNWRIFAIVAGLLSAASFLAVVGIHLFGTEQSATPCADWRMAKSISSGAGATPGLPRVTGVYPDDTRSGAVVVRVGSRICVAIRGAIPGANPILFVNGRPMTKLVGVPDRAVLAAENLIGAAQDLSGEQKKQRESAAKEIRLYQFTLSLKPEDMESWRAAIGRPGADGKVDLQIGAGPADGKSEFDRDAAVGAVEFTVFQVAPAVVGLLALVFALVSLGSVARNTGLLRDGGAGSPYSLGRCQMAWWLFFITGGFLYILFVTGQYNGIITPQALTLLGISGATGLAALSVDALPPSTPPVAGQQSVGLLTDILTAGNSPMLHRIQILIWTLILGVIFLIDVYSTFGFPAFDPNLLIMMGISGSFYLGFKAGEK